MNECNQLHAEGVTTCLIVAMDSNRGIGFEGKIPWNISPDMVRFKQLTMGKPVIMGHNTFQSIGRALPGRENILLTRDRSKVEPGHHVVMQNTGLAVSYARDWARANNQNEVFIIGGQQLYEVFLNHCDRIYLTRVDGEFVVDTFFPEFESDVSWEKTFEERHPAVGDRPAYVFEIWDK